MVLGALLDAGLPLAALREALGSLAIDDFEVTASKVLRAGVSATKFDLVEHGDPGRRGTAPAAAHSHAHHHGHDHAHAHRHQHAPRRTRRTRRTMRTAASRKSSPTSTGRALTTAGKDARKGPVPAAGGGGGGHPPDAGRARAPARGRRARLDHRHRRRGVRARLVQGRPHRLLADQCRQRHGPLGARCVPGAGAGHGAPARRRADLLARPGSRAADADRRAAADVARGLVRPAAGDASRRRRLRRGAIATSGRRRTCCACWSARPTRRTRTR